MCPDEIKHINHFINNDCVALAIKGNKTFNYRNAKTSTINCVF